MQVLGSEYEGRNFVGELGVSAWLGSVEWGLERRISLEGSGCA